MSKNTNLRNAKTAKKDEFYTQLTDIENEMNAYIEYNKEVFSNKTIFCNCDDPYESNFFKYFAMHFNDFNLKRLIATCYDNSPISGTQLSLSDLQNKSGKTAHKIVINEVKDFNKDGAVSLVDVEYLIQNDENVLTELKGNGDFRSDECIELLKQADIVVTNPPFSLFREYVGQLVKHNKQFIIIGNQNAITYKEIFPLIKNNKIWLGKGFKNGNSYFTIPKENAREFSAGVYDSKTGMVHFRNVVWFTNLPLRKRYEPLQLMTMADNIKYNKQLQKALVKYNCDTYPKYDNFDALEVPTTAAIPKDYAGIMGVPITFLDKYCPEQFDIIGCFNNYKPETVSEGFIYGNAVKIKSTKSLFRGPVLNSKALYFRVIIKYTDKWKEEHPQDFKEEK